MQNLHDYTTRPPSRRRPPTGGMEPTTGCTQPTDVGRLVLVPYTADYIFYKATRRE